MFSSKRKLKWLITQTVYLTCLQAQRCHFYRVTKWLEDCLLFKNYLWTTTWRKRLDEKCRLQSLRNQWRLLRRSQNIVLRSQLLEMNNTHLWKKSSLLKSLKRMIMNLVFNEKNHQRKKRISFQKNLTLNMKSKSRWD